MSEPILDLIHDASDAVRRVSAAASEVAAGRMHVEDARVEAQSIVERLRAMAVALHGAEAGQPLAYTRAPEVPPGASVQFQGTISGIGRAAEGNGATLKVWPDNAARFTVPIPYNGWREGVHLGRRFIRAVSLGDRVRVTVEVLPEAAPVPGFAEPVFTVPGVTPPRAPATPRPRLLWGRLECRTGEALYPCAVDPYAPGALVKVVQMEREGGADDAPFTIARVYLLPPSEVVLFGEVEPADARVYGEVAAAMAAYEALPEKP